jgi:hypothetical protein
VTCNFILISPLTVSAVGPVVLHRIWCEQVVPPGGIGGTGHAQSGDASADRQS